MPSEHCARNAPSGRAGLLALASALSAAPAGLAMAEPLGVAAAMGGRCRAQRLLYTHAKLTELEIFCSFAEARY